MRKFRLVFALALLPLILVSCGGEKTVRVVEKTYPDGKENVVVYYSDDKEHAKLKEEVFYPDGKLQSEGSFLNNQRNGVWRVWYQNGNIWSEGEFAEGKAEGYRKVFYENGRPRYTGQYKNDQKTGEWVFYDENGRKIKVEKY